MTRRTGKTQSASATLAGLVLLLSFAASPAALGETFRVDLPELQGSWPYGQSSATASVDLGTPLADLASIRLELSGVHTAGWFVGDGVENFYNGPLGGVLYGMMDSASSYAWQWVGSYTGQGDGQFTVAIALRRAGGGADWSFLSDGTTDFTLDHELLIGWGSFTTLPSFDLTAITLVIDATPALPGDATRDGIVDISDLNRVLTNYNGAGMTWGLGDVTGDGIVDIGDLNKVLTNYNKSVEASAGIKAVPEPCTITLLLAGAACLLAYRRRSRG